MFLLPLWVFVQLNGKVLELNATVQEFKGVQLFKDLVGVNAKVVNSNHMVQVFFDGDKALVRMSGMYAYVD